MASIHSKRSADWGQLVAPDGALLETLALEALARFPQDILEQLGSIQMVVAEYPEDQLLNSLGLEDPSELLGVFETNIFTAEAIRAANIPAYNRFWLFRRPILDHWAAHGEPLGMVVSNLLVQELGYSLDLSEEALERMDAAVEE
ncbi:MAG: metallopeptidase family protein [Rhodobacteraceae bacterium]|nr:metallopeptidase family protein [Paracoccaceae bacterium]